MSLCQSEKGFMRNLICYLFGHKPDGASHYGYGYDTCERKRCYLEDKPYDGEWTNKERFGIVGWPIHKIKQSMKLRWVVWGWRWFFPRCWNCNKLMFGIKIKRDWTDQFCSKKCKNLYVPF